MLSSRLHSEYRGRYSHSIRSIHYSAPEGRKQRRRKSHRKKDVGLRNRLEAHTQVLFTDTVIQ